MQIVYAKSLICMVGVQLKADKVSEQQAFRSILFGGH
jgi:hypothetical protein